MDQQLRQGETTLESWKEIAGYLQKDITTVRRWERREGLPIHRHVHENRSSVYAYPSEIDAWRSSRKAVPAPAPARLLWKTPAFAATILLCLLMVGNGVRPQVVQAQGQTRTLICSGDECDGAISPDGKSLLVKRNGDTLEIRDIATKKVRPLVQAPGMRLYGEEFSPDGSRVVYCRFVADRPAPEARASEEVVVVNVDGSNSRTVFRGGGRLAWSPNGKRLLIESYNQSTQISSLLWLDLANSATQKLNTVRTHLDLAKVSPDGKFIAFNARKDQHSEENVYVMASDGSGETLVSPSAAYQEPVEWTPDGRSLAFVQFGVSVNLWTVPIVSGKLQGPPVNTHVEFPKPNSFHTDRSGAVYYRTRFGTSDIFTATIDPSTGMVTSPPTPVPVERVGSNVLPRWAPDSRRLVYVWSEPGSTPASGYGISVFSLDTGKTQRVATSTKVGGAPSCWSPDGVSVLFNVFNPGRGRDAVRFNLETSQVTPLFTKTSGFFLRSCSNDLAAAVDGNAANGYSLKIGNLANGSEKEIYRLPAVPVLSPPLLSHDGRNIAFVAPNKGTSTLRVISSAGGVARDIVVANPPAELQAAWGEAWSPDDRFLYFARRPDAKSPHELFRVPAAGGPSESTGLKVDDLRDLDIAPDGTRIAFSVGATNRPEIWALRNFLPSK